MALFKKLKGSRSKSTSDILSQYTADEETDSRPKTSENFHAAARASRSTADLKAASSQSVAAASGSASAPSSPGAGAKKAAWVPKQRLVPQAPIPYRHVPTHAATDAFRTLQGNGTSTPQPYNYNYWQNLGVYGRGGRTHIKRSQSSSEISTGSIDSVLCSCSSLKSDDGYYHPILAQEMRHCCHSPMRKGRSSIRSSAPSTATSTPASSIYHLETTPSRPSSFKDASIIRPTKSVSFSGISFSDDIRRSFESSTPSTSTTSTSDLEPYLLKLPPASDADSIDNNALPSIPESSILEPPVPMPEVVLLGAEPVEELQEEVVAEAVAEDDAASVDAYKADEVVMLQEHLGKFVMTPEGKEVDGRGSG